MSTEHRTTVEPLNLLQELFVKFMNGTASDNETTAVFNRELCPKSRFSRVGKHPDFQVTLWSSRRKALSFRHALCYQFLFSFD